jgi:hypothetical protein
LERGWPATPAHQRDGRRSPFPGDRTDETDPMDKKIKKKQDVLHQRLQKLHQQLAGARKQMDDPEEVRRLEQQVAAAEAELAKLK